MLDQHRAVLHGFCYLRICGEVSTIWINQIKHMTKKCKNNWVRYVIIIQNICRCISRKVEIFFFKKVRVGHRGESSDLTEHQVQFPFHTRWLICVTRLLLHSLIPLLAPGTSAWILPFRVLIKSLTFEDWATGQSVPGESQLVHANTGVWLAHTDVIFPEKMSPPRVLIP